MLQLFQFCPAHISVWFRWLVVVLLRSYLPDCMLCHHGNWIEASMSTSSEYKRLFDNSSLTQVPEHNPRGYQNSIWHQFTPRVLRIRSLSSDTHHCGTSPRKLSCSECDHRCLNSCYELPHSIWCGDLYIPGWIEIYFPVRLHPVLSAHDPDLVFSLDNSTVVIFVILLITMFKVMASNNGVPILGTPGKLWDLLQSAAIASPAIGAKDGSYLTLDSGEGLLLAGVILVSGFGSVFVDPSYGQKAIAGEASAVLKGYCIGGKSQVEKFSGKIHWSLIAFVWFSIPLGLCATMSSVAVVLQDTEYWPATGGVTVYQINNTLILPLSAQAIRGIRGVVAIILIVSLSLHKQNLAYYSRYSWPSRLLSAPKLLYSEFLPSVLPSLCCCNWSLVAYWDGFSLGVTDLLSSASIVTYDIYQPCMLLENFPHQRC